MDTLTRDMIKANDVIIGDGNSNALVGTDGDDTLQGGFGNDRLEGKAGSDRLEGGGGDDIYVFRLGDGNDTVFDFNDYRDAGRDTFQFGQDISSNQLSYYRHGLNLVIRYSASDSITIPDYFQSDDTWANRIEVLKFLNEPFTTIAAEIAKLGLHLSDGNDQYDGGYAADWIMGDAGDDSIRGMDGDDTLEGGAGNDTLEGVLGVDTYRFKRGDGHDRIVEVRDASRFLDGRIEFASGIRLEDMQFESRGLNTVAIIYGEGDSVTVSMDDFNGFELAGSGFVDWRTAFGQQGLRLSEQDDRYVGDARDEHIDGRAGNDHVGGGDGRDTLLGGVGSDSLSGDSGDDRLEGGKDGDWLYGGAGADTFVFNKGDGPEFGFDTVADGYAEDSLLFTAGIRPDQLRFVRNGDGLEIHYGATDRLFLQNYFYVAQNNALDTLRFANGESRSLKQLVQLAGLELSSGNDTFTGSDANERVAGREGNDMLDGRGGNDSLSGDDGTDLLAGGTGNDELAGGRGDDFYTFVNGDGADVVIETAGVEGGSDTLHFVNVSNLAGLTFQQLGQDLIVRYGAGDSVTVRDYFASATPAIEQLSLQGLHYNLAAEIARQGLLLSDGDDEVTTSPMGQHLRGGLGNDRMIGLEGNDVLEGNEGHDTLIGGGGFDELYGGDGNDWLQDEMGGVLNGGNGNDTLAGSNGSVQLFGGAGDDVYDTATAATIVEREGEGTDTWLSAEHINLNLVRNIENAVLKESAFSMTGIIGNQDNNHLTGNLTGNHLDGGIGNDTLLGLAGNDLLEGGEGSDLLEGGDGDDQLRGGKGQDTLRGGAGLDRYYFDLGDDPFSRQIGPNGQLIENWSRLEDKEGVTELYFGPGVRRADLRLEWIPSEQMPPRVWLVYSAQDRIELDASLLQSPNVMLYFANDPAGGLVGMPASELPRVGGDASDWLQGTDKADVLIGKGGNDQLSGLDGNDWLSGGAMGDVLIGGRGIDTLIGGEDRDEYVLERGDDPFTLQRNPDGSLVDNWSHIIDREGDNAIRFGVGIRPEDIRFERIPGTPDSPNPRYWLIYSPTDRIELDQTEDGGTFIRDYWFDNGQVISHGALFRLDKSSIAYGTEAGDLMTGSDANEWLFGLAGDDNLMGYGGNDVLEGGDGNDQLEGGLGQDLMRGGAGNDHYKLTVGGDAFLPTPGPDGKLIDNWSHIDDSEGQNEIWFGEGVLPAQIRFETIPGLVNPADGSPRVWLAYSPNDRVELDRFGATTQATRPTLFHFPNGQNLTLEQLLQGSGGAVIKGTEGADTLNGGKDANELYGLGGNDLLFGYEGNDTLDGGAGKDTMVGGVDDDRYEVDDLGDITAENANEGKDSVFARIDWTLQANTENLTLLGNARIGTGNALDNVLTGNDGVNQLLGGDGNDTLIGGLGVDTLVGGKGNDYYVNLGGDQIVENAGEGTDTIETQSGGYTLQSAIENLRYAGTGNFQGYGNSLHNWLVGGSGNDTLVGNAGHDTLDGGAGRDTLVGGLDNDNLNGGADNDSLMGDSGNDRLQGELGDDTLDGGSGFDTLIGGAGNDVYIVDSLSDSVTELANDGLDTVRASVSYTLGANLEQLTLTGTAISATGNAGNNLLVGNASANQIKGGKGDDRMEGEIGNDTYLLSKGDGKDVIRDRDGTTGNIDTVQFTDATAAEVTAVLRSGDALVLQYGAGDQVQIERYFDATFAATYRIEQFKFSDGVVWTDADIQSRLATPAPSSVLISAAPQADSGNRLAEVMAESSAAEMAGVDQQLQAMIGAMAAFEPDAAAAFGGYREEPASSFGTLAVSTH
ncbi:calcium-binding protein [Parachitinimonas caeni]|uniref:Calcium-binding protein n=1 Tax=Parachitinimonas caeni TaxID=3031301 RepID=A0ABT7DRE0_9NEIS|nr:calcium-binding protein [Parachitinimonas caeni]MDK2122631.1 calcium-binding protein [Parachitinimonas caeni]